MHLLYTTLLSWIEYHTNLNPLNVGVAEHANCQD